MLGSRAVTGMDPLMVSLTCRTYSSGALAHRISSILAIFSAPLQIPSKRTRCALVTLTPTKLCKIETSSSVVRKEAFHGW
jgi:hypothetical protein